MTKKTKSKAQRKGAGKKTGSGTPPKNSGSRKKSASKKKKPAKKTNRAAKQSSVTRPTERETGDAASQAARNGDAGAPTGEDVSTASSQAAAPPDCVVVGVGASAGGLDAYKRLLYELPGDAGVAFVLVQHLDPTHESLMVELLSRHTSMRVLQIEDGTSIRPNHVYMIPPNKFVRIRGNQLYLEPPVTNRGVRLPIDSFFRSLAADRKERAICVVLSGTGSDGADGVREVKAEGGMTVVQKPETAEYDGMPRSAISTEAVDYVLPLEEMADVIVRYAKHPYVQAEPRSTLVDAAPDHFRAILSLLHAHTDHDFTRYKKGTLARRIARRMSVRQLDKPSDYLKLLRDDREEIQNLFKDFLIGVTGFFRDSESWRALTDAISVRLLEKEDNEPFRVWVPACSTGEEAYSIAMLLAEQQKRQNRRIDMQIFATDIDPDAVDFARRGTYRESVIKDVPESYIDASFQREGEQFVVRKRLREACIFAVQNVLTDPPFSGLDLICCRNLLIYLEAGVQRRVFQMMHFSLRKDGLLFLGSSEAPPRQGPRFDVVSQPARIYRKSGDSRTEGGGLPLEQTRAPARAANYWEPKADVPTPIEGTVELSKRALLEEFAPASVVINQRALIQYFHGAVRRYLDFPTGEPDLDLFSMVIDGLKSKTRTAVQKARTSRETVSVVAPRVRWDTGAGAVQVRVQPLPDSRKSEKYYLVSFLEEAKPDDADDRDKEKADKAVDEGAEEGSNRHLELELQAVREDLQSTIEELESANEELKASNEEVMSMNEELQSTNEELETSREELQSLNEELSTVNNQLHDKVEELEHTTNDLSNLLISTDMATLFLDSDLRIRRFTPATERLMNLLPSDIGRPLSDLAPRVNDPDLAADAREVLHRLTAVEKEVRNGGNRTYIRRVTPFRTSENKIEGVVVTFTEITRLREASARVELRERQQAVVARLGRIALANDDLDDLFNSTTELVADTLNVEFAKILWLQPDGRRMKLIAGVGWDEGLVGSELVPMGSNSQAGYTLQAGGPVVVANLANEKRFSGPRILTRHGIVSGMSIAIGPESSPWGVLGVHSSEPMEFSVDDTNFIQAVANILWDAIHRDATEERFRVLIDTSAQMVWTAAPSGEVAEDSPSWREFTGQSEEEWLGFGWLDAIHPDDRERVRSTWMDAVKRDDPMNIEYRVRHVSGDWRWTEVNAAPIIGQDHQITSWVGMNTDITENKKLERDLQEASKAAEAANEAKSVFLANMSHEIRSPMTAILGYADVLYATLDDGDAKACVKTIKDNGDYLLDILNDILDLSKVESGKFSSQPESFSLIDLLADVRSLMAVPATEKGLALSIGFEGEIPESINSDPKLLRQILVNLVSNGIKFTDAGSVKISVKCSRKKENCTICVEDTGVGIPEDQIEKMFHPFEQLDNSLTRSSTGSGLGMTISQQLIGVLGGELSVKSVVGEGTRFEFSVPTGGLADIDWIEPTDEMLHMARKEAGPFNSQRLDAHLLVVDDRREIRFLVRELLVASGARVEVAASGQQAIDKVRATRNGREFDAIVMDIQMPQMDGLDATRRIRESGYRGPVVALTANVMPDSLENCYEAGMNDVVTKPIDREELIDALLEHIAEASESGDTEREQRRLGILCIDDNEATCGALESLLEMRGYDVRTALSAGKALAVLREFTPDVALIDYELPGMSGSDLLKQIKLAPGMSKCAYVCLTGRTEDEIDWRANGFDYFLQKPVNIDAIEAMLGRM